MVALNDLTSSEYWKKVGYSFASDKVSNGAIYEMTQSQLPGRVDGPADAYRHLLLSAEMTRKMKAENAKTRLDFHEFTGNRDGQANESERMDINNNNIGVAIGEKAKSWNEVVILCRKAISEKQYMGKSVIFLHPSKWESSNPKDSNGIRMKNNDSRLNWPPKWPENNKPYPGNKYMAEPNSTVSENINDNTIQWDKIIPLDISNNHPEYQKICSFLNQDAEFIHLSNDEKDYEIRLFIQDGNAQYKESQALNSKNELGFSQASVDKHNEENSIALSQNQSQGRRLG